MPNHILTREEREELAAEVEQWKHEHGPQGHTHAYRGNQPVEPDLTARYAQAARAKHFIDWLRNPATVGEPIPSEYEDIYQSIRSSE